MFRLAHISDLHLLELSGTSLLAYANKRILGALNLALGRAHRHQTQVVERALQHIEESGVDHVAVTGDLSNLSLDGEFALAAGLLEPLGDGAQVSVIPGNHDRYTYGSARSGAFERFFERWMQTEFPEHVAEPPYPYVKLLGDEVALVGLSSSIPTPPFFATGRVSKAQLSALARILRLPEVQGRFSVVLVHHPLGVRKVRRFEAMRRLVNATSVRRVLLEGGADLVLHGHNHVPTHVALPRGQGDGVLHIVDVGSTSTIDAGDGKHSGRYNVYEIEDGALVAIRSFRYDSAADEGRGAFVPDKSVNRPSAPPTR